MNLIKPQMIYYQVKKQEAEMLGILMLASGLFVGWSAINYLVVICGWTDYPQERLLAANYLIKVAITLLLMEIVIRLGVLINLVS